MHSSGGLRRAAIWIAGISLTLVPFVRSASAVTVAQCTSRVAHAPVGVDGALVSTATLRGCTPVLNIGGRGTAVTNLKTHVSTIMWSGGRGSTVAEVTARHASGPNRCPSGTALFIISGEITGGSGAALNAVKVGTGVSVRVCLIKGQPATLEPGSVYKFNAVVPQIVTSTTRPAPTTTTRPAPTTTIATPSPAGNNVPAAVAIPAGTAECPSTARSAMITLVNADRHGTGNLAPLAENANLDWAARKHSVMMATTSNMTHNGWDTEIHDSHFVVGAPGWTGQNIAWMTGGFAPAKIESGFFNELPPNDGHRLNILSTNYHKIGIGCIVNTSSGAYWWTQDFGS
jgi:uncharacterized protein YkwD